MAQIYISVGSNIQPQKHIQNSIKQLQECYGKLLISSVYESAAVGFAGDNFYNLVVAAQTNNTPLQVYHELRRIEEKNARQRGTAKFASRSLDLDLILYDDWILKQATLELPRDEIERYAFVLQPLAEIAPHSRHPLRHKTYAELWQEYDKTKQKLWPIDLIIS
jgi:2-amino-4-hydroxy-6-hydroxymethyldihydropteridine diphosphokinase